MKTVRIVFMGTPQFSVPVLEGLLEEYQVVGVVTQPDKLVGRKQIKTSSPIKELALQHKVPVLQPVHIRTDYQDILDLNPDLIVTCAYGQMIPNALLEAPKYGCINVHASLLPKLRGGAPIHKAIIDGYSKTGITIMYMVEKMDAGDIISQKETLISDDDTLATLTDRLSQMGKKLLLETLPDLLLGKIKPTPQEEKEVTYAYNIKREEEHLDFSKPTRNLYNQIRGLNPTPGAYALLDGKIIKLFSSRISDSFYTTKEVGEISRIYKDGFGVATKDGELIVTEIQMEGKKRLLVKDYWNGSKKETWLGKILK